MLKVDLNFTLHVVGQRQKFESILHKFYYLYPFMQNIILLPKLPYLYIDRSLISMVVKPVRLVAIYFHCERDERKQ